MSILLLGNGINLYETLSPKWEDLIMEVGKEFGCKAETSLSNILGYEMLENQIMKKKELKSEFVIHKSIADKIEGEAIKTKRDWSNTIHSKLMELPVTKIFTTNYDYAIERSVAPDFAPLRRTTETTYSLHRYQRAGNKEVYHIHGECKYPQSICLGYEQYSGTLHHIRSQIVKNTAGANENGHTFLLADIMYGLTNKPEHSWIYDFFMEDIYILGLSLDVSEMDLWWILSYRSKQLTAKKLPITNRIVFIDTGLDNVEDKMLDCKESGCLYKQQILGKRCLDRKRRKTLLETFDVKYKMCKGNSFSEQYIDAIQFLKRNCK